MSEKLELRAATAPGEWAAMQALLPDPAEATLHRSSPRYRPSLTRIALRGDAVVGCALLSHRRVRLGASVLDVGDVTRIATLGDDATLHEALLLDSVGTFYAEGLPFARVLRADPRYTPYGFAPVLHTQQVVLEASPSALGLPLRAAQPDDLDDLAAIVDANADAALLTELRGPPDWRFWLANQPMVLVLEDSRGRVSAYAALSGSMVVREAAAVDAGAARDLCAALQVWAAQQGLAQVVMRTSLSQAVGRAALQLGGAAHVQAATALQPDSALYGVVDLAGALTALSPVLELRLARSRYASWSGHIRFELDSERITLAFTYGHAALLDGSEPADVRLRNVTLAGFVQLVLGYRSAADLRATGALQCDDTALGLLDAIFPPLPF